jgi:hypothetical protein
MKLTVLQNEQFTCHSCTNCCRNWHVELLDSDVERICNLNWPANDPLRGAKVILKHAGKQFVADAGYKLHLHAKLKIQRRHERQRVTGLVVNQRVNLPRSTRRWLRAVEHHVATGKPCTLTDQQRAGWRALVSMIEARPGE